MKKSRIDREKEMIDKMIGLYCRHKLKSETLPSEFQELRDYAHIRLNKCKFGNDKSTCKRCPIHCYKPEMREKIRMVMRWAGPRMIIYDPMGFVRHMLNK
jgi:hypothetical protein